MLTNRRGAKKNLQRFGWPNCSPQIIRIKQRPNSKTQWCIRTKFLPNSSSLEEGGAAKIAKLSAVLRQDVMRKYFDFATQAQKSLSTKDMNACRDETEWMHASGMKIPKPRPELRQKINDYTKIKLCQKNNGRTNRRGFDCTTHIVHKGSLKG